MNIEKDGFIIKEKLDKELVLKITDNVAQKIVTTFPKLNLNENEISTKLFCLNMYKAQIPEGMAEASYSYKSSSIYFNFHIANEDLEEFAIHECLHYLQEIKNNDGNLKKMGLSSFSLLGVTGVGLNEAAVQYMAAKIIGIKPDFEKYYDISLYTPSPSYYPIECALLNELIFFIGEDILINSTYFSTNNFKQKIINLTSKKVFNQINSFFDDILKYEEKITTLNNKILEIENDKKITKLQIEVFELRKKINTSFFEAQNLIIQNFFDALYEKITNLKELETYRRKLTDFSQLIGVKDNYTFFDNYYHETMNKLEHKSNMLENGGCETALSKKNSSLFAKLLNKIKKLISSKNIEQKEQD